MPDILTDITEAVHLMEVYRLDCLVWKFDKCPLQELQHYEAKGWEDLVVVCRKEHSYIPTRLVYDDGTGECFLRNIVTLNFHPEYGINILLEEEGESWEPDDEDEKG